LTQSYRVHLGTFIDDPDDSQHIDHVKELCGRTHFARLNPNTARLRSLGGLITNQPLTLGYYRDAGLQAWAEGVLHDIPVKRILVFSSAVAQYASQADHVRRIVDFVEKPDDPPAMPGNPDHSLASMGIYVFNAEYLFEELGRDMSDITSNHDFGKDIIPKMVREGVVAAHPFDLSCVGAGLSPYWRDVGTIDAYWDANIDLTATDPQLNLYDTRWPVWTYQPQLPPAKFVHNADDRRGMAIESLVSGGCIVSGAVFRSLLFSSVRVHSYSKVDWSVLLPQAEIGRGVRLTRVVLDRGCSVPDGVVIGEDPAADAARFHRTESGITLVTRDMLQALQ
jgi:glucose-1-phosphate adenylyltransferase